MLNFAWKFWLCHFFCQITYFDLFWGTLGVSGKLKDKKLHIPLKMTPRSWKFAQRYNFWSQICPSFRTNHNFWLFLGHSRGQKASKIAHFSKGNPPWGCKFAQTNDVSSEIWYFHSFRGQITNFDPFWGSLGIKSGSKMVKNCLSQ